MKLFLDINYSKRYQKFDIKTKILKIRGIHLENYTVFFQMDKIFINNIIFI